MNDVPIQIRNPEVVRAIRTLAEQTGRPITEAVGLAVNAEIERRQLTDAAERDRRLRNMREAVRQFRESPIIGPLLTDDDIYDADGLPR